MKHFTVFLILTVQVCTGFIQTSNIHANRIIFAIDTSASMEIKDANLKIKQAITTWIKYFAPQNISVGIVHLKQNQIAKMEYLGNDEALFELSKVLPETAYGGPCLQCGLQHAIELLETPTDKDVVLVLMEESSVASPHDTPEYALEEMELKFPIHTLAIS